MLTANELMNVEAIEAGEKAGLVSEIQALSREAAKLQKSMDAAIADGDMEAYAKYEEKRRATVARKAYLSNKLDNPAPLYTRESVLAAWADYAADYNADIAPLLKEYREGRRALASKFLEIVRRQAEAQKVQNKLNALYKAEKGVYIDTGTPDPDMEPLKTLPNGYNLRATMQGAKQAVSVDVAYFCAHGNLPPERLPDLSAVVDRGDGCDIDRPISSDAQYIRDLLGF